MRYTEAGSLDTSFCGSGICTYGAQYGSGYAVAVQPDGKIVCAGELLATGGISVVRLLPNGDPDPSFGSADESHPPGRAVRPGLGEGGSAAG